MTKPILLYSVIYPETARIFTEKVLAIPEDEPIDIWLNSPGGNPNAGWSMAAVLQGRENVTMTVMGDASSMAFYMLLFATKTIAYDTAKLLIHRAAAFDEDKLSSDELNSVISQNDTIRDKLESRVDENKFIEITGVSFDEIFTMNSRIDVTLTAEQGKEIGLIDEVIVLDTRKREEIESTYYNSIAALSFSTEVINSNNNNNNNNSKRKIMGIFDGLFGSKAPILLAEVGDIQCLYSKLEKGEKVKAIGESDIPVTGTFEKENKQITIVDNEITAIAEINAEAKRIEVLEAKIEALTAYFDEKKPEVKQAVNPEMTALEAKVEALTAVIEKAKLSTSSPVLPTGEFKEAIPEVILTSQERLTIAQNEAHEAKIKEREEL